MRTMYEYDLYFPNTHHDAAEILRELKRELTEFFGGLTDFRHRSEGAWKFGGVTYRDEVILLRMLGDDRERSRAFLQKIRVNLQERLEETEILIVEREVHSLADRA